MTNTVILTALLAAICPDDNVPNFCGKSSRGGTSFGDPVDIAHGRATGYLTRTDFRIATPFGPFEFSRTFATSWKPSVNPSAAGTLGTPMLRDVGKAFGGATSDDGVYWWHNLLPILRAQTSGLTHYRTSSGRWVEFEGIPVDCGAGTRINLGSNHFRETLSLTCFGADTQRTFITIEPTGLRYFFSLASGNLQPTPANIYATRIESGTRTLAVVNYARPAACSLPNPQDRFPYIETIELPSTGQILDFEYVQAGMDSCPVRAIYARNSATPAGTGLTLARYTYDTTAGTVELRSAETDFGLNLTTGAWAASRVETYCGYGPDSVFRAIPGYHPNCSTSDSPDNQFSSTSTQVTDAQTPTERFSVSTSGVAHVDFDRNWGDGSGNIASTSTEVHMGTSIGFHTGYAAKKSPTCAVPLACPTTQERFEGVLFADIWLETSIVGQVPVHTVSRKMPGTGQFLTVLVQKGGPAPSGPTCVPGTECTLYGWTEVALTPKLEFEQTTSVLDPTKIAMTTYRYHANGLLEAEIRSGLTEVINGSGPVLRHVGTFHRLAPSPACSASGVLPEPERIVEIEGPCFVSGPGATGCDPEQPAVNIQHFRYYQPSAQPTDVGRLMEVISYPNGCNGGLALTRSFSNYWPSGDALRETDENGHVTERYFDTNGRVLLSYKAGALDTFFYEHGRLTRHVDPAGLETDYCYRESTLRPDAPPFIGVRCDGRWTGRLEWKATTQGNAHQVSTNFFEALVIEYSQARTVLSRTYVKRALGLRKKDVTDFDGDGNLVLSGSGQPLRVGVRRFDSSGRPEALGDPFNAPLPLCLTAAGGSDPRCVVLKYNSAAGHLTDVEVPKTSSVKDTPQLAYDIAGNLCGVAFRYGDNFPSAPPPSLTASCTSTFAFPNQEDRRTALYRHDDFGNVVSMSGPGFGPASVSLLTGDFLAGARGSLVQEYGPSGVPVRRRPPDLNVTDSQYYHYDALGRLREAGRVWFGC